MATRTSGRLCPVLATPQNDIITTDNVDSLAVDSYSRTEGTKVKVSCYWAEDYKLEGSDQVTCLGGQWRPATPTCVRKDVDSSSVPDDSNTTITDSTSSPDGDTYTTVIILVAVACVVVVMVLVVVIIARRFRHRNTYKHVKEDKRGEDSVLSSRRFSGTVSKSRDVQQPSAPPSLWSIPPSQRYLSYRSSYHLYVQHENPSTSRGSSPLSFKATWRGTPAARDWTYLSVDRLLRDIETSRRNNPNHSWRDFASLSTDLSTAKSRRL